VVVWCVVAHDGLGFCASAEGHAVLSTRWVTWSPVDVAVASVAPNSASDRRVEWKGAIAQPGLSEYPFGAAGEEIFYGQATTTTSPLLNAAPSAQLRLGTFERDRREQTPPNPRYSASEPSADLFRRPPGGIL
jgi:hypothetical protein